jgi:hypothetical protein
MTDPTQRHGRPTRRPPLPAVLALGIVTAAAPARAADAPEYNRDVRPILSENCFACHGPDSAARKAKLRLDLREEALKKGAVVPGQPDKSGVIERIFADDPGHLMPPPKSRKTLTSPEKDTLRRWVAAGAPYQLHWSFLAPKRPRPPAVRDAGWVRNPVDAFILAELEKRGLQPAPEADRRTLARRVSLDLTGLPPSPAEVESFVNDPAPDAYERYVDRLLASPHWGEHRGRYWLDAARYADTNGIHFDNYREMWTYREWVIKAFNRNQPFDQFTLEQLAGDLLPEATRDQKFASGFNRCNVTTNEGGAIDEEYLVLYTRDRTETSAAVWLGLTANCAVCHDHKFDPLTQREFYRMGAYFNNTTQAAMDGNVKDTPPVLVVPRPEDQARWDALQKDLADTRRQADARKQAARAEYDKWLAAAKAEAVAAGIPTDGLRLHAPLTEGEGKAPRLLVDGKAREVTVPADTGWGVGHVAAKALRILPGVNVEAAEAGDFDRGQAFSYGAWVKLARDGITGALLARMDEADSFRGWDLWVQNGAVGAHVIHKWPQDALKVVSKKPLKPLQWNHVFVTYDGSGRPEGLKVYVNGESQATNVEASGLKGTIRTPVPLKLAQRHTTARLNGFLLQDVRVYGRELSAAEAGSLAKATRAAWLVSKPATQRAPAEADELFDGWLTGKDTAYQALTAKVAALQQEEEPLRARGTVAHVMQERADAPSAFILFRGDYDKRRDKVDPGTPAVLPPMPPDLPRNRLGFARWLLRPEHPLTARVTVNRFWQEVFGTGIVKTSGDFGTQGEPPSHPELLDWLAVEFRESGWDVKCFFRLLVTSAAYRQAAVATPEKREKDGANRLLSRGPRFRLDGELIRDYALAASGLLVRRLGGPSVRPYQPDGVWEAVAMPESDTHNYRRDTGPALYRRSLYTLWKRAAPPASMEIFNAPTRENCTVRRERTNTPLQALVTLNDPQFVEAARHLAQRALKEAGEAPEARADFLARRLLCRPLRPEEAAVVRASTDDLLAHYRAHPDDAAKLLAVGQSKADPALDPALLAVWTMTANEVMNLDEVLNK